VRDGVASRPVIAFGRRLGDPDLEAPWADVSAWKSWLVSSLPYVGQRETAHILRILSFRVLVLDSIDTLQLLIL
jgi:hypothetical protein